jgi:hypothetical protein
VFDACRNEVQLPTDMIDGKAHLIGVRLAANMPQMTTT